MIRRGIIRLWLSSILNCMGSDYRELVTQPTQEPPELRAPSKTSVVYSEQHDKRYVDRRVPAPVWRRPYVL